jgi:FtsH-binding integral membrane protein
VLSLLTFAGLTVYVHVTGTDFSFLRAFLCVSFFIMVGGVLLGLLFSWPLMNLGLAAFGTLVFAGWILYDTSQILRLVDDLLTPAVAAFDLILDIVGLHSWLMDLLGLFGLDFRD